MMYSLIIRASLASVLLLAVSILMYSNVVNAKQHLENDFYSMLNKTVHDDEIRNKMLYFFQHYPIPDTFESKNKSEHVLAALSNIVPKKNKGKNRSILDDIGELLYPSKKEKRQRCERLCNCETYKCTPPICPALPLDGSCEASPPLCHPVCEHQIFNTYRPTPTPKTNLSQTSLKPTVGSAKPKLRSAVEVRDKDPDEEAHREAASCCVECMGVNTKSKEGNIKYKVEVVKKANYPNIGTFYFFENLENSNMNETTKQELINTLTTYSMGKLDPKFGEATEDLLQYFNEKRKKKRKSRNRMDKEWEDTKKEWHEDVLSIVGHVQHLLTLKREQEICKCHNKSMCPPINLQECEGRCPNNPGCPQSQCKCIKTAGHELAPGEPMSLDIAEKLRRYYEHKTKL